MSRNVVSCAQPAGQGNDFELIPTVQLESQHSVSAPTSRDFSNICNHFADLAAWSRKSLTTFTQRWPFGKKTPYGQIFKNVFRKDSPSLRSTSCEQISWNLADRKPVKSCIICVTKKTKYGLLSRSRFCADRAPNLTGASSRQYSRSTPNFIQICSLSAEL